VTPIVLASGIGSSACVFQFSHVREPLYGRDLETWAIVAAHKRSKEFRYRMRIFYTAKRLFIPRRWETPWVELLLPSGFRGRAYDVLIPFPVDNHLFDVLSPG